MRGLQNFLAMYPVGTLNHDKEEGLPVTSPQCFGDCGLEIC